MKSGRNILLMLVSTFVGVVIFSRVACGMVKLDPAAFLLQHSVFHRQSVPVTLWAWERAEDLSFLAPQTTTVAYYAGTFFVLGERTFFKPRLQQLILASGQPVFPVFRIDNRRLPSAPGESSIDEIVNVVAQYQATHHFSSVQIDYDATESERDFYRRLLHRLRGALKPGTHISITALCSWCLNDRWLQHADADEVVAMIFSMGQDSNQILNLIKTKPLDTGAQIDISYGISASEKHTNEKLAEAGIFSKARWLYIFDPLPWTDRRFRRVKEVCQP